MADPSPPLFSFWQIIYALALASVTGSFGIFSGWFASKHRHTEHVEDLTLKKLSDLADAQGDLIAQLIASRDSQEKIIVTLRHQTEELWILLDSNRGKIEEAVKKAEIAVAGHMDCERRLAIQGEVLNKLMNKSL